MIDQNKLRELAQKAAEHNKKFIAMDDDGTWCAYDKKPEYSAGVWHGGGDYIYLIHPECTSIVTSGMNFEVEKILELSKNMANSPKDMDNSTDLKPSNSTELKALAQRALDLYSDDAQWIAIDTDGDVYAYESKPYIFRQIKAWYNVAPSDHWRIGKVAPPADYTKELYKIKKLLNQ